MVEGIWVPFEDGIEFKIARWGNPAFSKCVEKLSKPHQRQFRLRGRKGDAWDKIVWRAAAEHVLLDWKNVDGDNGKPLKYSIEEGIKIFTDDEFAPIADFIVQVANEEAAFYSEQREDAVKN